MNKILVITPIYKIIGRNELNRDTECVHDLIKKWKQHSEVQVIFTYIRGLSQLPSFFNPTQLKYYINGYRYNCDDIDVLLLERQNVIKNQLEGTVLDKNRIGKIVKKKINNENANIEIIHIPSSSKYFMPPKSQQNIRIAVLHYTDVLYLKKKKATFIKYLEKNFDKIFCRSKAIYQIFKKYELHNLSDEIIYSGVPPIKCNIKEKEKLFEEKKIKFLYVGKLIKRKNLDILIKALSQIINVEWELNVIGDGPMAKKYIKLVNQLDLSNKVFFLGKKEKKEVFKYMQESHVFCMPSIRETLGLVYIEAMACGCITIGTKNEGIDGIIIDKVNGFLTNANVKELTKVILKIINSDVNSKKRISKEAIDTGNYYNEEEMSKRYYNIVTKVRKYEPK